MKRREFVKSTGLAGIFASFPLELFSQVDSAATASSTHRIMSCNVRTPKKADEDAGDGWQARKAMCMKVIQSKKPDIFCLQECTDEQLGDFRSAWPKFSSFAILPGATAQPGTIGDVIFFSSRYEVVAETAYWLSATPHIPNSVSWDSKYSRFVNWVRLRDKTSGQEFRVINTHFDHKGIEARLHSAEMLTKDAMAYPANYPQVLVGDLNSSPWDEPVRLLLEGGWTDTYTELNGAADPGFTSHAFLGERFENSEKQGKIDWIFYRGPIKPLLADIIKDRRGERYPSDHYFLLVEFAIQAST